MFEQDVPSNPELTDDGMCFGCGPRNPIGLHLKFWWEGDKYCTSFTPERLHQGWAGRTHGGILSLVLDEMLSRAVLERHGLDWVTVEICVRLRHPATVGRTLTVASRVDKVRSQLITSCAEIADAETGKLIASATGKLMRAG